MNTGSFSPISWLLRFTRKLRFPQLFALTGAIFLADLFIPDAIPFVDELLLGLVTALLGSLRRKDVEEKETT